MLTNSAALSRLLHCIGHLEIEVQFSSDITRCRSTCITSISYSKWNADCIISYYPMIMQVVVEKPSFIAIVNWSGQRLLCRETRSHDAFRMWRKNWWNKVHGGSRISEHAIER